MIWVLVGLLAVVAAVLLLRDPVREALRRRDERARERKRQWRRDRDQQAKARRTERAMNREKAAARAGEPTWQQVAQRSGSKCWLCGTRTYTDDRRRVASGERFGSTYPTVDWVVPIERGGSYAADNARIAHRHCARVRQENPARTEYGTPRRTYPAAR